ncbi:MAG: shikimate kinase [Sphingomonadales bacterium]|nr:shikimate kinase [Sphingomonadales bacterium]MDE2167993.1 shikimate kinase [Sphingomonadales bacterium]
MGRRDRSGQGHAGGADIHASSPSDGRPADEQPHRGESLHSAGAPDATRLTSILARIDRPIVLVGMMGVGKSSLGRKLASQLGAPFIDADEAIETSAQMTIPEIFAAYGESFFRDGERRVIARLMGEGVNDKTPVKVIATGGGAFVNEATRSLILRRGIAIWIDAELDTLVERTARKDNRPLLQNGNPRDILGRLKREREPFYAQAPIHVVSGNTPHSRTLGRMLGAIEQWLDHRPTLDPAAA